jgi:hypothetical protein
MTSHLSNKAATPHRATSSVSTESRDSIDKNVFQKALDETKRTFSMAEGEYKTGDVMVQDLEEGLKILNAHVQDMDRKLQAKNDAKIENKAAPLFLSWMDLVPLNAFHATQDEFFVAFLKWSIKEEPPDQDEKKKSSKKSVDGESSMKKINVTKATRRLNSYFEWMSENMAESLKERPLTWESIEPVAKVWDVQVTVDDEGRFIWWIDLGGMNVDAIKAMDPIEHVRYVVWFSHLVLLNTNAQDNGAIIVENCGRIGFFKMMTLLPMELSAKLDRLTIGILPVKMKAIHIFGAAMWMQVVLGLMRPFMSKKMRERMVIINERKTDMQAYCDELVTRKHIPKGYCGLQGGIERDAFYQTLKK